VTRHDLDRLEDVLASCNAIKSHLRRGDLADGLIFDAVRVRLIEIGEAVKDIDPEVLDHEQQIAWREVAGMRDRLAHRYFDTSRSMVQETVNHDLPRLEEAVLRLVTKVQDR